MKYRAYILQSEYNAILIKTSVRPLIIKHVITKRNILNTKALKEFLYNNIHHMITPPLHTSINRGRQTVNNMSFIKTKQIRQQTTQNNDIVRLVFGKIVCVYFSHKCVILRYFVLHKKKKCAYIRRKCRTF